MASAEHFDTIVVGGGMAGLYAAYLLQEKHKRKTLLLEAKDRIGGRIYATDLKCAKGKDRWDLGGQWVGKTQFNLLKVMSDFKMDGYEQFSTGTKKLIVRDFSDIRSYSGLIPSLGPLELLEMNSMMKRIDKLCDTIDLEKIATHPNAVEWDSITLQSYMNENCRFQATKEMFETAIRVVFGVDLSGISLLYFLYYCKQGGSFETLLDAKNGGAQEIRVKGTMFSLCEKIAEKLENVMISEPVEEIDQETGVNVKIRTKSGKEFQCDHVIVAIAPHLVNNITFLPSLPNDRISLGEASPPSHYIKFVATYKRAFWKDRGMSGELTCTTLPCATGPITVTFDGTTSNDNPAIIGFIGAEHAIYWTSKTMEQRREAVLQSLAAAFGEEALDPIQYLDKDWSKEPYNGGCPVNVMRPRALLYFHHALKQQFGRIHWAGTETARVWCGYIDGALESSFRSVAEIVDGKPLPLTKWNTSPAFDNPERFKSSLGRSKSRLVWRVMRSTITVAVLGYAGYLIATKYATNKE